MMDVDERNMWIERSAKYLRLVADNVESVVITTNAGDTITFRSNEHPTEVLRNDGE